MEEVILVDEKDRVIGKGEKLQAHKDGKLHRALSIFVFNSRGETLLQKRAKTKYHSGGLWTNTCCSHPRPGEKAGDAASRRLEEEMGFTCRLREVFTFTYKVQFENGLSENEYDHVFVGKFDGTPRPNPEEVADWKWISMDKLKKDIEKNPGNYTYWLKVVVDKMIEFTKY